MPDNQPNLESQYREAFSGLKDTVFNQLATYLSEGIEAEPVISPELQAKVGIYQPIVESIVKALKDSGIINAGAGEGVTDEAVVQVITEQTSALNQQSKKIKELQMRVKLHEMISENLSGLSKDIIREAVTKFQGEDDIPEDELLKKLTKFINTRKTTTKSIQFESINSDIDEVDNLLEGTSSKEKDPKVFKPKKKIDIKGLKKRVVMEAEAVNVEDDAIGLSPADEFMRDFGRLGN